MKYPKTIDTLLYKRLDESRYKVKNSETGEIFELGRAIVSFMNLKLKKFLIFFGTTS